MNKLLLVTLSLFTLSFTVNAIEMKSEIEKLLEFVENSGCKFERNGDMHSGADATKHIKKKYDYYFDDIKTAEDFIELSATKSKFSGDYYKIHCKNESVIKSKVWLLNELENIRNLQKTIT